ncbi:hypothetical protein COOONC_06783, partial [Cooperia oncophora]
LKNEIPFQASSPVPPVPDPGRGHDTSYVTVITDAEYDESKFKEYMDSWNSTKIEEYSKQLGDLVDLRGANIGGHFAFAFTLLNSDCTKVRKWMTVIVSSSPRYVSAPVVCYPGAPPTTTTTAPSIHTSIAQAVPQPAVTGKGNENLSITLNTRFVFNPNDVAEYWNYWSKTKIDEYAGLLGNRQYTSATSNGVTLSFSFGLTNSDCDKVSSWLRQIVRSSPIYKSAYIDGTQCKRLITWRRK